MRKGNTRVRLFGRNHGDSAARGAYLAAGAAALAVLLGQSSPTFGAVEYFTSSYYKYQTEDYVSLRSSHSDDAYVRYSLGLAYAGLPQGGLPLRNEEGYSASSGHADAANLHLGADTWSIAMPNTYLAEGRIRTEASNRFTVSPGTSGLLIGDTVTLHLDIRLDGTLKALGTVQNAAVSGSGVADVTAGLSIHDGTPVLAKFDASSDIWAITTGSALLFSSGWKESWRTESNISAPVSHSDSGKSSESGAGDHVASHYFNPGMLTLSFEAIVGHTLDVDAYLDTHASSSDAAGAHADFNRTFALDLTPSVSGLVLDWQVVPEPGSLSLLALGSLTLLRRRSA